VSDRWQVTLSLPMQSFHIYGAIEGTIRDTPYKCFMLEMYNPTDKDKRMDIIAQLRENVDNQATHIVDQ
jgi:hypothetical protein